MGKGILVIGSLNIDMVINMKEMPLVGETILGDGLSYVPGGKGANQSYAIGRMGGKITMLGSVGADEFGESLVRNLDSCGVNSFGIRRSKTQPTGMAIIYVNERGNNSIVVVPGANQECDISYLEEHEKAFEDCDYVILQMEIPYDAVFYAINKAKSLGKKVVLNPAPAPESLPDEIYKLVDYITPNETELMKLAGETENTREGLERGAEKLLKKGVGNVLVTMGDQGALLVNREGINCYPAAKVRAVDSTAAGDCFNGAFVVALSEGKSNEQAILFANAASGIAVTRKGAQSSIPFREETEKALGL